MGVALQAAGARETVDHAVVGSCGHRASEPRSSMRSLGGQPAERKPPTWRSTSAGVGSRRCGRSRPGHRKFATGGRAHRRRGSQWAAGGRALRPARRRLLGVVSLRDVPACCAVVRASPGRGHLGTFGQHCRGADRSRWECNSSRVIALQVSGPIVVGLLARLAQTNAGCPDLFHWTLAVGGSRWCETTPRKQPLGDTVTVARLEVFGGFGAGDAGLRER